MESYGKVAITIGAKQRASVVAAVQPKVCKEVCKAFDETEGIGYIFGLALDEALQGIGISREFEDCPKEKASHTIIISHKEGLALEDLQAEVWRKGIMAGRSVPRDVVNQLMGRVNRVSRHPGQGGPETRQGAPAATARGVIAPHPAPR
jgi:hypothetical protein